LAALNVTVSGNLTTPVSAASGTIDHFRQWALQNGDVLVLVMVDGTGGGAGTASFTPNNVNTFIEGNTSGVYQNSAWAPGAANTDLPVFSSATPEFVSVWSTRISMTGGGGAVPDITVTGTFAGSSGTRRMFLYAIRPKHGLIIPNRSNRLIGQGTVAGTGGGPATDSVPVAYYNGNPRGAQGAAMIVIGAASGGSTAITVDADNDGTAEITTNDAPVTASTFVTSAQYNGGDAHRPGTTVKVAYPVNPSTHVTGVLVYATQLDTLTASRGTGMALRGSAVPKGGRNVAPTTNLRSGVALSGLAWPRSKYAPPTRRRSGVAISGKASPKYVKRAAASSGGVAIDGIAAPFQPPTVNRPDLAVPPGAFTAPSQAIFDIRPTDHQGIFFIVDGDSATATEGVQIALATTDTAAATDTAALAAAAASGDTATATEAASIVAALTATETGTGADVGSIGGLAVSSADTATAIDAAVRIAVAAADTAVATEGESITVSGGASPDTGFFFFFG
jgi:hypothetical protein